MMSKGKYYFGFHIRKHPKFTTSFVSATDFGYIVTEKVYGFGRGRKAIVNDNWSPSIFTDKKNGFVVFSKECEAKEEMTEQEFNDVMRTLRDMIPDCKDIEIYHIQHDRDHMVPVFKDFNDMHKRLRDFMDKIFNVVEIHNVAPTNMKNMDHKHIIIKKAFDINYYKIGLSYSIKLKDHPLHEKLRASQQEMFSAICCDATETTLEFMIVEPPTFSEAPRCTNIVILIDDVEKYDIEIIKNYPESEVFDIVTDITNHYQSESEKLIGKPMKFEVNDIPDTPKDDVIRGRRLTDLETSLVNVGEPVNLDDYEAIGSFAVPPENDDDIINENTNDGEETTEECDDNEIPDVPEGDYDEEDDSIDTDALDDLVHTLHIGEEIHPLIENTDNGVRFVEELKKYKDKTVRLDIIMKDEYKFLDNGSFTEYMSKSIELKGLSDDLKELHYNLKYSEVKVDETIIISEVLRTMVSISLTILD